MCLLRELPGNLRNATKPMPKRLVIYGKNIIKQWPNQIKVTSLMCLIRELPGNLRNATKPMPKRLVIYGKNIIKQWPNQIKVTTQ